MTKSFIFLALVSGLLLCGCSNSVNSSQSNTNGGTTSKKVKMSGKLPRVVFSGQKFKSTILLIGESMTSAKVESGPDWVHSKTVDQGKKLIVFGNPPKKEGYYHIGLSCKNNFGGKFGFSFRIEVIH